MFCPKCGIADQSSETYCRQCGVFLPDLSNLTKKRVNPEQHVIANAVLGGMTIVACFTLAILLWSILAFRDDTHPLIYITAGLLFAMGIWHIQTLWRSLLLKKYLKQNAVHRDTNDNSTPELSVNGGVATGKLLDEADFQNVVPPSVVDQTTRHLAPSERPRSAKTEH